MTRDNLLTRTPTGWRLVGFCDACQAPHVKVRCQVGGDRAEATCAHGHVTSCGTVDPSLRTWFTLRNQDREENA